MPTVDETKAKAMIAQASMEDNEVQGLNRQIEDLSFKRMDLSYALAINRFPEAKATADASRRTDRFGLARSHRSGLFVSMCGRLDDQAGLDAHHPYSSRRGLACRFATVLRGQRLQLIEPILPIGRRHRAET